jgi:energy-coupling factor transporter ATP-binding protein EcfA2
MKIEFKGKWKSIESFTWDNIAPFAIITGKNGVGKSQLLNMLTHYFPDRPENWNHQFPGTLMNIVGEDWDARNLIGWVGALRINEDSKISYYDYRNLIYIIWEYIKGASSDNWKEKLEETKSQLEFERLVSNADRLRQRPFFSGVRKDDSDFLETCVKQLELVLNKNRAELEIEEILCYLPEEPFVKRTNGGDPLDFIFFSYQIKKVARIKYGFPAQSGNPPWEILNETLEAAGLPYRVNYPNEDDIKRHLGDGLSITDITPYSIQLIDPISCQYIGTQNLSSGEHTILFLGLLLYYIQKRKIGTRFLVLDEPDNPLHPSLTKTFFDVIFSVLVEKYEVRVIITTHSPSTVSLAPFDSKCGIYEMSKNPTQIKLVENRQDIISLLSEGLVLVTPHTKYIFVEGKDDIRFYSAIYECLKQTGHIVDNIAFLPVKGKENVISLAEKISEHSISVAMKGLVDSDSDKTNYKNIICTNRDAVENYFVDPLLILLTTDRNVLPGLGNIISRYKANEHEIKNAPLSDLQKCVDAYFEKISKHNNFKKQETGYVKVEFINGINLNYPLWQLNYKGKDLLGLARDCFGQLITLPGLLDNMKRTQLIPIDLIQVLKQI